MAESETPARRRLKKGLLVFGALFLCGLLLVPCLIYLVGQGIFGAYADGNLLAFLAAYFTRVLGADLSAWFLVLSPYLLWQTLRLTVRAMRGRPRPA